MSGHGPDRLHRVVVADDHPVVRVGVRNILAGAPEFTVVAEANDGAAALDAVRACGPDLLLLDLAMPRASGLDVLRALRADGPPVHTLVLAGTVDRRQTVEIFQLGARGILLKDVVAEQLTTACRAVMAGRYWCGDQTVTDIVESLAEAAAYPAAFDRPVPRLTARQLEIVHAVVEGRSNRDIAEKLSISEETVKRHLTMIFDRTGMSTRLELAMYAVRNGLTP